MISAYRNAFNSQFQSADYDQFIADIEKDMGYKVDFKIRKRYHPSSQSKYIVYNLPFNNVNITHLVFIINIFLLKNNKRFVSRFTGFYN